MALGSHSKKSSHSRPNITPKCSTLMSLKVLGTKMCGQSDEVMCSIGRTLLITQKRISGHEGKEPGMYHDSRTKGRGGRSLTSWYLL